MDHSTASVGEIRITLRDDIRFRPQQFRGETCYVIEDAASSSFFRIGVPEYTLISLFNGDNSIADAMQQASAVLGRDAFTEHDAAAISRWLVESGLAKTYTSDEAQRLYRKSQDKLAGQRRQSLNPIITKIPVFRPEKLIDRVAPLLLWTTSWPAFLGWTVTLCVAFHQLLTHSDRLVFRAGDVLAPNNWLWLGATWLALKLVHELYHALFCRKYGGEVREAGIVLIAFAPIFYVDVTSSWRFPSKWQRVMVAAAGMYVEVFIGAIAAIIWVHSDVGWLNQMALNVVVLATVTTIVFNANPLMRFDGYYMLSDVMEIPNLAPQGQQYLSYWGKRYLYGVGLRSPLSLEPHDVFIRCYGFAAMVWRVLITLSIGIMVATLFHGAGLALAIVGLLFWILVPLVSNIRYLLMGKNDECPNRAYCGALLIVWGVAITLACNYGPWPFAVKAPGVVDYRPGGIVRTEVGGFVKQVHVVPGQTVSKGQLLAELENAQLFAETERLAHALKASEKRIHMASSQGDIASQKMEQENRRNLSMQLVERKRQLASFRIVAPIAGLVVSDELDSLVGTYLGQGHELMVIGNERDKEIRLSIAQEDSRLFASHIGHDVTVKLRGGNREKLKLPLSRVEPGASTSIDYLAITAAAGGSLVVRPTHAGNPEQPEWEYVEPRLSGRVELDAKQAESLRAGQLAMVKLPVARSTFGVGVRRFAEDWFRSRWRMIQES